MEKYIMKNSKNTFWWNVLKTFLIWALVTVIFILIFATVMYFIEGGYEYSPLFATVSAAMGTLFASMDMGKKIGQKGLMTGGIIGGITFFLITLISLILDSSALGINTLFRFVIIMLSSLIGGVVGVNRKINEKYI